MKTIAAFHIHIVQGITFLLTSLSLSLNFLGNMDQHCQISEFQHYHQLVIQDHCTIYINAYTETYSTYMYLLWYGEGTYISRSNLKLVIVKLKWSRGDVHPEESSRVPVENSDR